MLGLKRWIGVFGVFLLAACAPLVAPEPLPVLEEEAGEIELSDALDPSFANPWTEEEILLLASLSLDSLPELAPDPSNLYSDDMKAAALGQQFFFDTRFSINGEVACASCHKPELLFTDGLPLAENGVGITNRKTMTILGTAYSPWQFWDGRKDSQWAQALGPWESPVEHGGSRTQYVHIVAESYAEEYEAVFGPLPDFSDSTRFPEMAGPLEDNPEVLAAWESMAADDRESVTRVYVNMGKAVAAYERLIMPGPSRFDDYVRAVLNDDPIAMQTTLTADEIDGLQLFISEEGARCIRCHNGPLFTNNEFHNTGLSAVADLPPDDGRMSGVQQVLTDEFNCLSPYSDAESRQCGALRFVKSDGDDLLRAYRPPTLRNVVDTPPYMHAGQMATLETVLDHYNNAPAAPAGRSELEPLNLDEQQLQNLIAFLGSLRSPPAVDPALLQAPILP
jgi:cytochrome c peroxidase